MNEISVDLITDMSFAKNITQVTYKGKKDLELEWNRIYVMA